METNGNFQEMQRHTRVLESILDDRIEDIASTQARMADVLPDFLALLAAQTDALKGLLAAFPEFVAAVSNAARANAPSPVEHVILIKGVPHNKLIETETGSGSQHAKNPPDHNDFRRSMEDATMGEAKQRKDRAAEMRELCEYAGLDQTEMREDPQHGLLITASGVRKLCAIAEDQPLAQRFSQFISTLEREGLDGPTARRHRIEGDHDER